MSQDVALVTGGAGFIGSHLVAALLERGDRIRVLDDFSSGRAEWLPNDPRLEIVKADIRDAEALRTSLRDVEVVFHQAALRSVPRSLEDPYAYHDVNATGTLRLLLAAREAGVRRLVFASSSSVYGDQATFPLHEALLPRPISPYAASKLIGEHYCAIFSAHYAVETVSLRYFNVYGPRQDPASQYAAVVARFALAALQGIPFEIHGDGLQTRDFTYVENIVAANLAAADAEGVSGQVFNVACGERVSLLDLVSRLEQIMGRPLPHRHVPSRPGDIRDTLADLSKVRARLGYLPAIGLAEGLRRTIESLRS